MAVDQTGLIYAGNYGGASVTEYPKTASGNVVPTTRIIGSSSTLVSPYNVFTDPEDNLWVGDYGRQSVSVFYANLAITNVTPPTGTVSGGETVTIHGFGIFPGGGTVTFGGVSATSVSATSPITLTAVVPAHAAGTVDVAYTQDGNTVTIVDGFTYTPTLATTGVDAGPATSAGILLLLVGGLLLAARRRLRRPNRA